MDAITLKIAVEFSETPGVREEIEGDFPGEEFLKKHLLPKFEQALRENKKLVVDMDDTAGYPTSFLEAAFGGLVRHYHDKRLILRNIEFISKDDPFMVDDIIEYVNEAE